MTVSQPWTLPTGYSLAQLVDVDVVDLQGDGVHEALVLFENGFLTLRPGTPTPEEDGISVPFALITARDLDGGGRGGGGPHPARPTSI